MDDEPSRVRVDCVGGLVRDARARLLLVRRGQEPGLGLWSVPGGRVEAGESDAAATAREVREETGLTVEVHEHVGTVERAGPRGAAPAVTYVIRDYRCSLAEGTDPKDAVAGDDADAVGWFDRAGLDRLDTVPGLVEQLDAWGVI